MDWKHLLASITGSADQELLLRNEYLVTENRMLRNQITGRVRLSDGERKTLVLHHSKCDGRYGHRVQSGQPIHQEDDQHAQEKISRDARG